MGTRILCLKVSIYLVRLKIKSIVFVRDLGRHFQRREDDIYRFDGPDANWV